MTKTTILMILLVLLAPIALYAQEAKKPTAPNTHYLELPMAYQKMTADDWEGLMKQKNHLNPFNTFPLINNETLQLDLGPAQFQFTIPF